MVAPSGALVVGNAPHPYHSPASIFLSGSRFDAPLMLSSGLGNVTKVPAATSSWHTTAFYAQGLCSIV